MEENNHIYPIFDKMLMRKDKEDLLKQHSVMVWFTGLSGSGKSTIAIASRGKTDKYFSDYEKINMARKHIFSGLNDKL